MDWGRYRCNPQKEEEEEDGEMEWDRKVSKNENIRRLALHKETRTAKDVEGGNVWVCVSVSM